MSPVAPPPITASALLSTVVTMDPWHSQPKHTPEMVYNMHRWAQTVKKKTCTIFTKKQSQR